MTDLKTPTGRVRTSLRGQWDSPVTSYYLLIGATTLLLISGLAMVLSASSIRSLSMGLSPYAIFLGQAQFALIGLAGLIVTAAMRPTHFRKLAWFGLAGAVGMQLLIFTPLAHSAKGNTNWIYIGSFSIQPSEVAKLALAIWLGMILARKQKDLGHWLHGLIPALPGAAVVIGLILAGHDLGTAIIVMMIVAAALWVAGVPLRSFLVGGTLLVGAVFVATKGQESGNRMGRIEAWLSAECDGQAACYQTKHGLWALGSGGWGGVGLGASAQKWLYLPEAHNDFIYAILGEELGLLGTLLLLVLFGVLAIAMTRIVIRHPDPFVKITTAGIAAWIVGQALVNIGVVIGLLPVIGVPLPLVSAGGSALIMTMAAIGVLISFARDEPGAREALAARPGLVRKSVAIIGGTGRRRRNKQAGNNGHPQRSRSSRRAGHDEQNTGSGLREQSTPGTEGNTTS